jgi:hypothetical protein
MLFEEEDAELRGWWTVSVALGTELIVRRYSGRA